MNYVAQRLLTFPLILFGVSILVFVAIRLIPGDAITAMLGTEAGLLTPAQRASLAAYFGIDQPILIQYFRWAGGLFHGDLGISATYGRPVLAIILERFPLTLELALLSMVIALLAGVPLVTQAGETVVSRIAGSQLHAIGVPELVAHDRATYEATALRLAQNHDVRTGLRARLAVNRFTSPLFDTPRFTRDFEAAVSAAWAETGPRTALARHL